MFPKLPCNLCKSEKRCLVKGVVARELIFSWTDGKKFEGCPEFSPDFYHGIEGVHK